MDTDDLIKSYFDAFKNKDLETLGKLLAPDIWFKDSFTQPVSGLQPVLAVYREIFKSPGIEFTLLRKYTLNNFSQAYEFNVKITDTRGRETQIDGIDLIDVKDGKISKIRAYAEIITSNLQ